MHSIETAWDWGVGPHAELRRKAGEFAAARIPVGVCGTTCILANQGQLWWAQDSDSASLFQRRRGASWPPFSAPLDVASNCRTWPLGKFEAGRGDGGGFNVGAMELYYRRPTRKSMAENMRFGSCGGQEARTETDGHPIPHDAIDTRG